MNKLCYSFFIGTILCCTFIFSQSAPADPTFQEDLTTLSNSIQTFAAEVAGVAFAPKKFFPNELAFDNVRYDIAILSQDLSQPSTLEKFQKDVTATSEKINTGELKAIIKDDDASLSNSIYQLKQLHEKTSVILAKDLKAIEQDFAGTNFSPKDVNIANTSLTARLASDLTSLAGHLQRATPESFTEKAHVSLFNQSVPIQPLVFISTGERFTSPYSLTLDDSKTNAVLGKNAHSTTAFLDLAYYNRYVMHQASEDANADSSEFIIPGTTSLDIALRLGFNFDSGTSSSNLSASTVLGGGDLYLRADVGIPFFRWTEGRTLHQATIELSGTGSTDFSFSQVHPELFTGLGYQVSFPNFASLTNSPGFIFARMGESMFDSPHTVLSADRTVNNVPAPGGIPQFDQVWAPSAGAVVLVAAGDVSLWVEANVYFKSAPAPWNISIGASLSGDQILHLFKGQ